MLFSHCIKGRDVWCADGSALVSSHGDRQSHSKLEGLEAGKLGSFFGAALRG